VFWAVLHPPFFFLLIRQRNDHPVQHAFEGEGAVKWISPDINAVKWEGYTPPHMPKR
jgi:hypothetical protein